LHFCALLSNIRKFLVSFTDQSDWTYPGALAWPSAMVFQFSGSYSES
jgi:hypothetical protein